jgi:hypothetical protein
MGFDNQFSATVASVQEQKAVLRVDSHVFQVSIQDGDHVPGAGNEVIVYFRAGTANLSATEQANSLPGDIVLRTFQGGNVEYIVDTALGEFTVRLAEDVQRFDPGPAYLVLNPASLSMLPDSVQQAHATQIHDLDRHD